MTVFTLNETESDQERALNLFIDYLFKWQTGANTSSL
jgi:hypothetical protein